MEIVVVEIRNWLWLTSQPTAFLTRAVSRTEPPTAPARPVRTGRTERGRSGIISGFRQARRLLTSRGLKPTVRWSLSCTRLTSSSTTPVEYSSPCCRPKVGGRSRTTRSCSSATTTQGATGSSRTVGGRVGGREVTAKLGTAIWSSTTTHSWLTTRQSLRRPLLQHRLQLLLLHHSFLHPHTQTSVCGTATEIRVSLGRRPRTLRLRESLATASHSTTLQRHRQTKPATQRETANPTPA